MVVVVQVGVQSLPERIVAVELLAPKILGLHRVEERFHVRVVVHVAGTVHALHDAAASERRSILMRPVLGEFNPSSQHFLIGGVDGSEEAKGRSDRTCKVAFARSTTCVIQAIVDGVSG